MWQVVLLGVEQVYWYGFGYVLWKDFYQCVIGQCLLGIQMGYLDDVEFGQCCGGIVFVIVDCYCVVYWQGLVVLFVVVFEVGWVLVQCVYIVDQCVSGQIGQCMWYVFCCEVGWVGVVDDVYLVQWLCDQGVVVEWFDLDYVVEVFVDQIDVVVGVVQFDFDFWVLGQEVRQVWDYQVLGQVVGYVYLQLVCQLVGIVVEYVLQFFDVIEQVVGVLLELGVVGGELDLVCGLVQ